MAGACVATARVGRICQLQLRLFRALCSETGRIAAKQPFQVRLEAGKTYFWCRCGLSKKQPFCDSSHRGSGFKPVKFSVQEVVEEAFLCGCKQTGSRPYCDGTHATPFVQEAHTHS